MCAVRGGSGRAAAPATRSFVVGGKSIAASKVYIALVLSGVGLRQIVLRLRRPAPGELDVDDGAEAAAVQRLGGLLHHLRIGQALLRGAHCGVGAIQHEVCAGHVEDQLADALP